MNDGRVCPEGGGTGGGGGVQNIPNLQRDGGEHQRGYPCDVHTVTVSCPEVGLDFPIHLCMKHVQ